MPMTVLALLAPVALLPSPLALPRASRVVMSGVTQGEVHGEGGAYVGGYWVPLTPNTCE